MISRFGSVIKGLKFEFTEKAKEILSILERIRRPYSKQDLIEYIRIVADELGRPPKEEDFDFLSKQKIGWGPTTIRKVFGSIYQALKLAKIKGAQKTRGYSRSEIILKIRKLVKELGFVPGYRYMRKISKDHGLPSANTITEIFGTYNKAIKSAGFRPIMSTTRLYEKTDKCLLIKQLVNIQKNVQGKKVGQKEINDYCKRGLCASYYKFYKEFGSIPAARESAGI